ncbi:efflux RND transporter periplasmic adaptor subunit [Salinisphaera sp. USBA-960]|nr:efflux RND transporter periplasmic adaptor subunit [Salifodinibacter halophilus]NNC26489.1 efflux RND transporter periplasmic adaptor subunit [Salifodinibacter halophilus]
MSRYLGAAAVAVLAATIGLAGCSESQEKGKQKGKARAATPVHVKDVKQHSVDVYSEFPGRVEGQRTVQIVARVEGILQSRHYEEGQIVNKGDLLYRIDPRPFQATVDQRKAELASDKAALRRDKRSWERIHRLYKSNAVSQAKRDSALSNLESARAAVKEDKANLENAQIKLGYTTVEAPVTGVTSLRETDTGSLVNNGTKLTTITQLNPVYVRFALPEEDAIARKKALAQMGNEATDDSSREATVILPSGKEYARKGKVDFTQSTIDSQTGTVQLRAIVDNPNNSLMPGRYVRVRVRIETRDNAIVVPEKAVATGQASSHVFVAKDGKAKKVNVELGPDVKAGRVITKGLSNDDRVIVSGLGQVGAGSPIKVANNRDDTAQGKNESTGNQKGEKQQRQARADSAATRVAANRQTQHDDGLKMAGVSGVTRAATDDKKAG